MEIVTGDDEDIKLTLTRGGLTFAISDSAIVKVAIVDKTNTTLLAGPIVASRLANGADWANSLIAVTIPSKSTANIKTTMQAKLEIQVNDGGFKKTWFSNVLLVKGVIQ